MNVLPLEDIAEHALWRLDYHLVQQTVLGVT